jgi:hypothetical protein
LKYVSTSLGQFWDFVISGAAGKAFTGFQTREDGRRRFYRLRHGSGEVGYDDKIVEEGEEEWIETVTVDQCECLKSRLLFCSDCRVIEAITPNECEIRLAH